MNVIRHASAKQVTIRFSIDDEHSSLEVKDDGRGFKVPDRWIELGRESHFGLAGAAERAEALGGRLIARSRSYATGLTTNTQSTT